MLNKWIKDQQQVPTQPILDVADDEGPLPRSGTRSNPYLAYPELGSPAFHESAVTVNSYDMVDDDDLPLEDEVHENEVREYQYLFSS
jgi:translation elongation factor EF-Tu-like GTPase